MGIYSANRSGSMATTNAIVANESYDVNDLGRILYESQCNDMALFEAIVASDLGERKALAEGTMLLSEAEEANKKSFKQILTKLKDRVIEWLKKIKGVFQAAIRKISAYILGNNKQFVADVKERLKNKKDGTFNTDKEYEVVFYDVEKVKKNIPSAQEIKAIVEKNRTSDSVDKADIIKTAYAKSLGGVDITSPSDFMSKAKEAYGEKVTIGEGAILRCINILENAKESIKDLKTLEAAITKEVNGMVEILKAGEKSAQAVDGNKDHAQVIKNMSTTVAAFESVLNKMVTLGIGFVKLNVKTARTALRRVVGGMLKEDADLTDAAVEAQADDLEAAFSNPAENINPELENEINTAIESVDAE